MGSQTPMKDHPPSLSEVLGQRGSVSRIKQSAVFFFFITMLMSVVVWDMRRVREMSEIIHDDRTDLWEHMNDTSLRQWLSPLDLCLLQGVHDSSVDIKSFRAKNCTKAYQQSNVASATGSTISPLSQRHFCNIGASLGKVCPGPLNTRTFFSSRLKDAKFRDANNMHLSRALRALAARNMPLIFLGDGLSKQNQDALLCDLMRSDSVTITSGTHDGSGTSNSADYSFFTDYTIRWKDDKRLKLDVRYYKVLHIDDENDGEEDLDSMFDFSFDFDFFGFKSKKDRDESRQRRRATVVPTELTTSRPPQLKKGSQQHNSSVTLRAGQKNRTMKAQRLNTHAISNGPAKLNLNSLRMNNRRLGTNNSTSGANSTGSVVLPRFSFRQIQRTINDFIGSTNRSVAIVANAGVWYNSREQFRRELPILLQWLEDLGKDKTYQHLVMYRETAAQHWNHSSNGYYDRQYKLVEDNNGTCIAIQDNTPGEFEFCFSCIVGVIVTNGKCTLIQNWIGETLMFIMPLKMKGTTTSTLFLFMK
jgi:hypothetical protein